MPIQSADIQERLSGGAANAVATASLGGAKSSIQAPVGVFDDVPGAASTAGAVTYRCVYIHNAHPSITLTGTVAWLEANTPSLSTTVDIGLGSSAVNGVEPAVTAESSAPPGVAFAPSASKGTGPPLGPIPPGQARAIWYRRTVNPGTPAIANDSFLIKVEGNTTA